MSLIVHRENDPDQNLLVDQHWEITDPIISCTNKDKLPVLFLSQLDELALRFQIWDLGLPLCIVPQVYHFLELVVWCVEHYSNKSRSVVTKKTSQIFITISPEEVTKMIGLNSTNFPSHNTITLSEDVLVQKFTSLSPQHQLSFVQGIQRPKYILYALNFPLESDSFQTPIQLILSMYNQVLGLYHD